MGRWDQVLDEAAIRATDEKYRVLRDHLAEALEAAKRIRMRPALAEEAVRSSELFYDVIHRRSDETVPLPETDDELINRYYPVLLLLPHVESAAKELEKRGFVGDELLYIFSAIPRTMDVYASKFGKPGLNRLYFGWLTIYLRAEMFYVGPFEFQVTKLGRSAIFLRNKKTGAPIAVASGLKRYHANGRAMKAGDPDEPDMKCPTFTETETDYVCYPAYSKGAVLSDFPVTLSKEEWEVVLKPGDDVLGFHIPKGADISPENVLPLMKKGLSIGRERFPEHAFKTIVCNSWLLDPVFHTLLGDQSNIVRFGDLFTRFPMIDSGSAVFTFVFPPACKDLPIDEWPEDTRLMRILKNHYRSGRVVCAAEGAVMSLLK